MWFIVIALFVSCQGQTSDDDGLNLTDEQLKKLMKNQPSMPSSTNGEEVVVRMEIAYQEDSSDINNVYNLAFSFCGKCLDANKVEDCNKAIKYLSRSIDLKADYRKGKAYFNRHLCYQVLEKYEEALADLDQFIPIHSKADTIEVNYLLAKATVLHQLDRTTEACQALEQAKTLDTLALPEIDWIDKCE